MSVSVLMNALRNQLPSRVPQGSPDATPSAETGASPRLGAALLAPPAPAASLATLTSTIEQLTRIVAQIGQAVAPAAGVTGGGPAAAPAPSPAPAAPAGPAKASKKPCPHDGKGKGKGRAKGKGNDKALDPKQAKADAPKAEPAKADKAGAADAPAAKGKGQIDPGAKLTVKHKQISDEQRKNLNEILKVGKDRGANRKVLESAVATVIQESNAQNLNHGDRDSQGLFQQRPSQGWGTVAQVRDPVHAANKYYDQAIPNDAKNPGQSLTQLAQSVQRSGFPDAYAQWGDEAKQIVDAFLG